MLMKDKYFFLSNFYPCFIELEINGKLCEFNNAEAAFQAQRNPEIANRWSQIKPLEAKRLGDEIITTVPDWEHYQLYAMAKALNAKFKNKILFSQLLLVDKEIVNDNYWGDDFWGVCTNKQTNYTPKGKNLLGKMLTNIKENNNDLNKLNDYIKNELIKDVD